MLFVGNILGVVVCAVFKTVGNLLCATFSTTTLPSPQKPHSNFNFCLFFKIVKDLTEFPKDVV